MNIFKFKIFGSYLQNNTLQLDNHIWKLKVNQIGNLLTTQLPKIGYSTRSTIKIIYDLKIPSSRSNKLHLKKEQTRNKGSKPLTFNLKTYFKVSKYPLFILDNLWVMYVPDLALMGKIWSRQRFYSLTLIFFTQKLAWRSLQILCPKALCGWSTSLREGQRERE